MINFCPRTKRVVNALWSNPRTREELDRIAGSSNSPDIIFRLRKKGLEIPCYRIESLDADGKKCRPGRYEFTRMDKIIVCDWLGV